MPLMNNFSPFRFLVLVLIPITSLFAAEPSNQPPLVSPEQEPLTLVAVKDDPPSSFQLPDGTITGFYVEFWKLWSEKNTIPVKFQLVPLTDSIQIVKENKAIHIALFANEERKEWADFSLPYFSVDTGIIYSREHASAKRLSTRNPLKIGVLESSYQASYMSKNYPSHDYHYFAELNEAFPKLVMNELDAIVAEIPVLNAQVTRHGYNGVLTVSNEVLIRNKVHAVVQKGNPEILTMINEGMKNIPVNEIIALSEKWLPSTKPFLYDEDTLLSTLTLNEKNWLQKNENFSLGIDSDFPPFEYINSEGYYTGLVSEYIDHANKVLGINIQPNYHLSWLDAFSQFKQGKVDLMAAAIQTDDRLKEMSFTKPYIKMPTAIIIRRNSFYIENMKGLNGKTLGLVKGDFVKLLKAEYPDIKVKTFESEAEGLEVLQKGEVDAFIAPVAVANYEIDNREMYDLRIAAFAPYNLNLSIAVRPGLEPLISILNKAFDSMTEKQKTTISNDWLSVKIQSGIEIKTILLWTLPIAVIMLLIITIVSYVNRRLKTEIASREASEQERKALESQLIQSQKMEALGNLTGGIAHDFNNLLGVIMGYSDLLKEENLDSTMRANYVNNIHSAGERGVKLTRKLLSFTQKQTFTATMQDINSVLLQQKDMLQKTLTVRIKLSLELDYKLWPVMLDIGDLENTILNLSINAMHSMEDDEPDNQLMIKTSNQSINEFDARILGIPTGDYVLLSFSDTGCGMDDETKNKIFDPFFTTKGNRGTGLGLSQVFGFVKRVGGTIKVMSKPGHGSQFILYFPRYQSEDNTEDKQIADDINAIASTATGNILIVDDEPDLRDIASLILSQDGFNIFTAANGKEAIEVLENEHIDLLLSDIIMPEIDGLQLAFTVEKKYPNIKIQLVSGCAGSKRKQYANHKLIKNLLHKPYDKETLLRRVHSLLKESQPD